MARKFLIEFMVEADEAVDNSDRLSKALGGVGQQVADTSSQMVQAQTAVTQVGSAVTQAATQSTQSVATLGGNATVLSGQLNGVLVKQQQTTEASGKMAESVHEGGESFGHMAHRSLFLFKALLGVEHIFQAIEKGSPIHAIMGLLLIFVKLDHFLGGHKKKLKGVAGAMEEMHVVNKAGSSVAEVAAKKLRAQAASLMASAAMTQDATEKQLFLNNATRAATEADRLEQEAIEANAAAKVTRVAVIGSEVTATKKLTLVQRVAQKLDRFGLKNLFSRNKQAKANRAGLLRDLILDKRKNKMSLGQMKVMAELGDKLGVTAQGAKYAEKSVGGVMGTVATEGKAAAGGMEALAGEGGVAAEAVGGAGVSFGAFAAILVPLIAALPLLVFGFKVLHTALEPLGKAFGLIFDTIGQFAKLVAVPLMMPMHALAEVVFELIKPFHELMQTLYPLMMALGKTLMEPLEELAHLMGPLMQEVIAAAGGFEAFTQPVKELTEALKPLMPIIGEALKETIVKMKPVIVDVVKMLVELFKVMIGLIQPVMEVFLSFLAETPEMFEAIVGAAMIFVGALKIALMIFKALLPIIKFNIKVMMFGWKLVNIVVKFFVGLMKLVEQGFKLVTDGAKSFFDYLAPAIEYVSHLFEKFSALLGDVGDVAKKVGSFFFGSGLWGLPEAIKEVTPSMSGFQKQLEGINASAEKLGDIKMPGTSRASVAGGGTSAAPATVVSGDPGSSPTAPIYTRATGPSGTATEISSSQQSRQRSAPQQEVRVSIPISLQMDGLTLARVLHEQIVSIGRDRWMNDPLDPLRGVESA